MKNIPITGNFKYPVLKDTDFKFGSGQLKGTPLRENGNWMDYVPPFELQRRNGVESSSCFVEGNQHAIAVIQEEEYGLKDQNYSARFTLIHSNGSPQGGSPIDSGNAIRKKGLIPESMLPFSDEIDSWDEFNSYSGGNERACTVAGELWLKRWRPYYDIVYTRNDSIEDKYKKLKEALKYSPIPMSVYGWSWNDDGEYVKRNNEEDNHFVLCLYVDEKNRAHILDTYEPFIKVLEPNYNSLFAMRWAVLKLEGSKTDGFWELLKKFFSFLK